MVANDIKSSVEMPKFNKEDVSIYINELKMWQFVTGVEKKKQGHLVWLSLPSNDSSNIKEAISNLSKDDGIDRVFELLKKMFQQEKEVEAFSKWKKFEGVRRVEGESIRSYVTRFNAAYEAITKM